MRKIQLLGNKRNYGKYDRERKTWETSTKEEKRKKIMDKKRQEPEAADCIRKSTSNIPPDNPPYSPTLTLFSEKTRRAGKESTEDKNSITPSNGTSEMAANIPVLEVRRSAVQCSHTTPGIFVTEKSERNSQCKSENLHKKSQTPTPVTDTNLTGSLRSRSLTKVKEYSRD